MKALLRSCLIGMTLFGIYAGVASSTAITPSFGPIPTMCPPFGDDPVCPVENTLSLK